MDSNAGSVCESAACKENIICRLQRVKWKKHSLKWDSSVMRERPCSGGEQDERWHLSRSRTVENGSGEVVMLHSKAKQAQERFVLTLQQWVGLWPPWLLPEEKQVPSQWHLVEYIQIVSCMTRPSAYESISVEIGREIWQHLSEARPARKEVREERRAGSTGVVGAAKDI